MAIPYFPEDVAEGERRPGERIFSTVTYSANAYEMLSALATATHVTTSDVVRVALSIYWWLAREHGQGSRFMVLRDREWLTDLVIPSLEGMESLPTLGGQDGRAQAESRRTQGPLVDGS